MKLRDLERHLRAHGAAVARDRGNHTVWTRDAKTAPVPRHREISAGLVRAICKQLDVPAPPNPR